MTLGKLRVGISGCSHWHLDHYVRPLSRRDDVRLVAVSDESRARSGEVSRQIGCAAFERCEDLCEVARPDLMIVLGQHATMVETADYLLGKSIPFIIEKPCGLSAMDVSKVAEVAERTDAFDAVAFVMRHSGFTSLVREAYSSSDQLSGSFRWIAGPPSRYPEAGCAWMLDPAKSGGGCTMNLAIHLVDMFCYITRTTPELITSMMSGAVHGQSVETYSMVAVRYGHARVLFETGYLMNGGGLDVSYSIHSAERSIIVRDDRLVSVVGPTERKEMDGLHPTNAACYPDFLEDTIRLLRSGSPPRANLKDAATAMVLIEGAYRECGWSPILGLPEYGASGSGGGA